MKYIILFLSLFISFSISSQTTFLHSEGGVFILPYKDTLQCRLMIAKENDFVPYIIKGYVVINRGTYLDWQLVSSHLYLDENKCPILNEHVWGYKEYTWKSKDTLHLLRHWPLIIDTLPIKYPSFKTPARFADTTYSHKDLIIGETPAFRFDIAPSSTCDTIIIVRDDSAKGNRRMYIWCPGKPTVIKDTTFNLYYNNKTKKLHTKDGQIYTPPFLRKKK